MTISELSRIYLRHLRALGRSRYTIKAARYELQKLTTFMEQETAPTLDNLTTDILHEYQQELAFKISVTGKLLNLRTQGQRLGVIKAFTRYLKEQDYTIADPGKAITLPKKPKRLPKVILNASEIKKIMESANIRTNKGYRNRVILEILYDTAIRRSELAGIKINNLDLNSGFIHVHGKGNKDRVVPLNQRVC
ncbi:MAG: tyrosine-type recombinase/integrase, partial [Desulfobacteraceae bacterium]|nr:tyrosine-type recombinase/integrase [Desulfobacteraceae bacterium]